MAKFDLNNMKKGAPVDTQFFLVSKKGPYEYQNKGGKWFELVLERKNQRVIARYWGDANEDIDTLFDTLEEDHALHVIGEIGEYSNKKMIYISRKNGGIVEKTEHPDIRELLPEPEDAGWENLSLEKLESRFWELVNSVKSPPLREVLRIVFEDSKFWDEFKNAPAALTHHSAYLHGLLHHTINVTELALAAATMYPVDRELLITGALVHDIGKVAEYNFALTFTESEEGTLLGHIYMGAKKIDDACEQAHVPDRLRKKLVHIVLSHHNRVEMGWGSARDPMFPEAIVIAGADYMDAQTMEALAIKFENAHTKKCTEYKRGFGRVYLK